MHRSFAIFAFFIFASSLFAQSSSSPMSLQNTNLPPLGRPRTLSEAYARKGIIRPDRPLPELKTPLERGIESRGFAFDCFGGISDAYSFRQRGYLFGDKSKPIDWGVVIYHDHFTDLRPYYRSPYFWHRYR